MEKINMKFNKYIFVSLLPNRCVLFNNSYHNNLVCSVRTPYFGRKSAFTQSCIILQPLQLLKKYFGELWPRSWLFGGIHFQFSIVNFIFHHFCTTLCHLIVILPKLFNQMHEPFVAAHHWWVWHCDFALYGPNVHNQGWFLWKSETHLKRQYFRDFPQPFCHHIVLSAKLHLHKARGDSGDWRHNMG